MSNLKGLAKLTRKGDLQRKIDEKTDYINRLKVGLSNMVRNSGFEKHERVPADIQRMQECLYGLSETIRKLEECLQKTGYTYA